MNRLRFFTIFVLGIIFLPLYSFGYEEAPVQNGATLTGTVRLNGAVPAPVSFRLRRSPFGQFCSKISNGQDAIVLDEYQVGADGGMQDTVIAVQAVTRGKKFEPVQANFFAVDCMFHSANASHEEMYHADQSGKIQHVHPLVSVFQNGQPISVINRDPIFHNGQVFQQETGRILLNFPTPTSGHPRGGLLHFEKNHKIVQMICGIHEYMQTYGLIVDNPYYAKTKKDGQFLIDQLPEGRYEVWAWHPHFQPIIKEITVSAGQSVPLDFVFESKTVRPRLFESAQGLVSSGHNHN